MCVVPIMCVVPHTWQSKSNPTWVRWELPPWHQLTAQVYGESTQQSKDVIVSIYPRNNPFYFKRITASSPLAKFYHILNDTTPFNSGNGKSRKWKSPKSMPLSQTMKVLIFPLQMLHKILITKVLSNLILPPIQLDVPFSRVKSQWRSPFVHQSLDTIQVCRLKYTAAVFKEHRTGQFL